ncbi:hypothetical protein T07_10995 [Trichinella nelsoni]|uniref:Uncharacterized protein n=1 Tax=Trichinella nelsoni TaxID=6336 RepID=A0A0V0S965_9BILA|nr:hypothetical protein T07_10995 [Trichinella nelsoni]
MAEHIGDNVKQVRAAEIDCIVSTQLTVYRQIVPITTTIIIIIIIHKAQMCTVDNKVGRLMAF